MTSRHNVVLLNVLPKERRSRHAYQLCMMLALITIGMAGIIVGPPTTSAVRILSDIDQYRINIMCVLGGACGVFAAIIPERVIRWRCRRKHEFDATWVRLWVELGCHGMLFFVWVAYLVAIFTIAPIRVGLSLGSGLCLWLAVAALWRSIQIIWTVKAVIGQSEISGVVGSNELPHSP